MTLRIAETNPKFVGRGVALMDPKVIDYLHLSTGDVIEISGKKKTFVLLWSSQPTDHGTDHGTHEVYCKGSKQS